jgi:hypothetical protein
MPRWPTFYLRYLTPQKASRDVRHAKSQIRWRSGAENWKTPVGIFPCDMKPVVFMVRRAAGSLLKITAGPREKGASCRDLGASRILCNTCSK